MFLVEMFPFTKNEHGQESLKALDRVFCDLRFVIRFLMRSVVQDKPQRL